MGQLSIVGSPLTKPSPADYSEGSILAWKLRVLKECLPSMMLDSNTDDRDQTQSLNAFLEASNDEVAGNLTSIIHKLANSLAYKLLAAKDFAKALQWARVAYVAGRHLNHAWLEFFDFLLACESDVKAQEQTSGKTPKQLTEIPRYIAQYRPEEISGGRLNPLMSWCNRNRAFDYQAYNDTAALNYLLIKYGPRIANAYQESRSVSNRSVIFGLAWLLDHGGVYADTNEFCNASIDLLIPAKTSFVLSYTVGRPSLMLPHFIASRPSNPAISRLLRNAVKASERFTASGVSTNEWMVTGPGGLTMTLLDTWCEHGKWPDSFDLKLITGALYRTIVESSNRDTTIQKTHHAEQPPKVPNIHTIRIDMIIANEENILKTANQSSQFKNILLNDQILSPGIDLTIISSDPKNRYWQDNQSQPALAPAAGVYWLEDINLSGHACLWKENRFIQLGSYLSDVAEGETRGGAWQTPWTHKVVRVIEEPIIVAFSPGYSCYGHWLVDELPRLGLLKECLGGSFRGHRFIFPEKIRKWGKDLLKFFFEIEDDQILYFNHEREMWRLKTAIIPTFLHRHYQFQPYVREFFSSFAPKDAKPHRRVCLSRRDWDQSKPDQRIFLQREKFERLAVDRGYELIAPEELSLVDQVRLMAETSVQIGEHGSAQHGSIYSRKSTIVGSINPLTPVQVNLGRIANDQNVLLFPDTMSHEPNGSLRFGCSDDALREFFDSIEKIQERAV